MHAICVSNLMCIFLALNLQQFTDSKVQLNKKKMNNHKFNDIARSYLRRCMGDGESMIDRLLQTGEF